MARVTVQLEVTGTGSSESEAAANGLGMTGHVIINSNPPIHSTNDNLLGNRSTSRRQSGWPGNLTATPRPGAAAGDRGLAIAATL